MRLYVEAVETGIVGSSSALKEMSLQPSKFRGGLFMLEQAEYFGLRNLNEFEAHRLQGSDERFVDMVMKGDRIWVECKDWARWEENRPEKMAWQFQKDVRLSGYDLDVFSKRRYVFRKPAPRSVAEIRAFLRKALVAELSEAKTKQQITGAEERKLIDAFDAEKELVVESALRDEHELLQPDPGTVKVSPPVAVPSPIDRDEEKDKEAIVP